jgi:hypothetical protein
MSGEPKGAKRPLECPLDGRVCAQHGRELMGCKSPVEVPTWTHRERRITTSRRQGQTREGLSGGSPSARGARRRTETAYKAEGCEASWHMTAKPTGTQPTVNAALVHRQFASLPGEICAASGACRWCKTRTGPHRDTKGPSAAASCPAACRRSGSNHHRSAQRDRRQRRP